MVLVLSRIFFFNGLTILPAGEKKAKLEESFLKLPRNNFQTRVDVICVTMVVSLSEKKKTLKRY
jgi:hypothetical protein